VILVPPATKVGREQLLLLLRLLSPHPRHWQRLDMKVRERVTPQRLVPPRIFFLGIVIPKVNGGFLKISIVRIVTKIGIVVERAIVVKVGLRVQPGNGSVHVLFNVFFVVQNIGKRSQSGAFCRLLCQAKLGLSNPLGQLDEAVVVVVVVG
jgi:hypothetical protein